jgi:hypothetical protein
VRAPRSVLTSTWSPRWLPWVVWDCRYKDSRLRYDEYTLTTICISHFNRQNLFSFYAHLGFAVIVDCNQTRFPWTSFYFHYWFTVTLLSLYHYRSSNPSTCLIRLYRASTTTSIFPWYILHFSAGVCVSSSPLTLHSYGTRCPTNTLT